MNVVFLHCHYDRGGVTSVVLNQLNSLMADARIERILLVSGPRSSGMPSELPTRVSRVELPNFDYDQQLYDSDSTASRINEISNDLCEKLQSHQLASDDTVLHWHNHSLGKNTALPGVVRTLAEKGWKTLLQIHDFAEDYRPQNYSTLAHCINANSRAVLDRYLYPVARQIHYCTLTTVDAEVLRKSGIPDSHVSFTPNTVDFKEDVSAKCDEEKDTRLQLIQKAFDLPKSSRWAVYPVRGIRRKNIGELLLLSQLGAENLYTAITLNPTTMVEAKSYARWKTVAEKVAPRAIFDAGHREGISFRDNLIASDMVLSTSVAEGFGMAFLEPWLFNRGVVARYLNNVVPDFESAGMQLNRFYRDIMIEGDQAWIDSCRREWEYSFDRAWQDVPRAMRPSLSDHGLVSDVWLTDTAAVDFALLSPRRQIEVLTRCSEDNGYREMVAQSAEDCVQALRMTDSDKVISDNAECVRSRFSKKVMQDRLMECYLNLLKQDVDMQVSGPQGAGVFLDNILLRQQFHPCRTEEAIG